MRISGTWFALPGVSCDAVPEQVQGYMNGNVDLYLPTQNSQFFIEILVRIQSIATSAPRCHKAFPLLFRMTLYQTHPRIDPESGKRLSYLGLIAKVTLPARRVAVSCTVLETLEECHMTVVPLFPCPVVSPYLCTAVPSLPNSRASADCKHTCLEQA